MKAEFSRKIKEARKAKGYSQAKLASLVGVAQPSIAAYEKPDLEKYPSYDVLVKLAIELEISLDYLFGLSENKSK